MPDNTRSDVTGLQKKINKLQAENMVLKRLLDIAGVPYAMELKKLEALAKAEAFDPDQGARIIPPRAYTREMAELFHDYFHGRDDVYAKRYVGKKSGIPGYYPQCHLTWKPECPKQKGMEISCSSCHVKQYKRLTHGDVYRHFQGMDPDGNDVLGIYPQLANGTCHFLVFDFDNHGAGANKNDFANMDDEWIGEVDAMREICEINGMDPLVERSRSGRGAHIWFFFDEPVDASLARRFGTALLDKGAEYVNLKSFRYYDRMMPTQDYLKDGGIGNLIALPLQGQALRYGNSAFIDENWNAYPDQWEVLRGKPKLSKEYLEAKIKEWTESSICFEKNGGYAGKPWEKEKPFSIMDAPDGIKATLSDGIYIRTAGVAPAILNSIRRMAAFRDSTFFKKKALGMSNKGRGSWVSLGEDMEEEGYLRIPRGLLEGLKERCGDAVELSIKDGRSNGRKINVAFKGTLRPEQEEALDVMLSHETGILQAATSFGKTVLSCALIAERKTSTLILFEKTDLIQQWMAAFEKFLNIDEEMPTYRTKTGRTKRRKSLVGKLQSQHDSTTGIIDIAMAGSVIKKGIPHPRLAEYGMVIVDECHHAASGTEMEVLSMVKAKYVYGISATPERADGMEKAEYMILGPIRHRYTAMDQAERDNIARFVRTRFTNAVTARGRNEKTNSNEAYEILRSNQERDAQIVGDVKECIKNGRTPVLLSRFKDHSQKLYDLLKGTADHVFLVMGSGAKESRKAVEEMKAVSDKETLILIATGKKLGEGFDFPRLDTLLMVEPVSFEGVLEQFVGRLGRRYPGKDEVIVYDYVDRNIPIFDAMFNKRIKAYRKLGYEIAAAVKPVPDRTTNAIFDIDNYREPYLRDLQNAGQSIIISSPAISWKKVAQMESFLKPRQEDGVKVTVITIAPESVSYGDAGDWMRLHEEMRSAGFVVMLMEDFCQHYTIIDDRIVWYGSMNFLSKEKIEDNLIREEDPLAVSDLKRMTFGDGSGVERLV